MKQPMIDTMSANVVILSQNAYGNYALQVALEVIIYTIWLAYSTGQTKIASKFIAVLFPSCNNYLFKNLHLMSLKKF